VISLTEESLMKFRACKRRDVHRGMIETRLELNNPSEPSPAVPPIPLQDLCSHRYKSNSVTRQLFLPKSPRDLQGLLRPRERYDAIWNSRAAHFRWRLSGVPSNEYIHVKASTGSLHVHNEQAQAFAHTSSSAQSRRPRIRAQIKFSLLVSGTNKAQPYLCQSEMATAPPTQDRVRFQPPQLGFHGIDYAPLGGQIWLRALTESKHGRIGAERDTTGFGACPEARRSCTSQTAKSPIPNAIRSHPLPSQRLVVGSRRANRPTETVLSLVQSLTLNFSCARKSEREQKSAPAPARDLLHSPVTIRRHQTCSGS
jgi:hypothetical protein